PTRSVARSRISRTTAPPRALKRSRIARSVRCLVIALKGRNELARWATLRQHFEGRDDHIVGDQFRLQEAKEQEAVRQGVQYAHELGWRHGQVFGWKELLQAVTPAPVA